MYDGRGGQSQGLYSNCYDEKTFLTLHFHFTLSQGCGIVMGLVQVRWVAEATWPTASCQDRAVHRVEDIPNPSSNPSKILRT